MIQTRALRTRPSFKIPPSSTGQRPSRPLGRIVPFETGEKKLALRTEIKETRSRINRLQSNAGINSSTHGGNNESIRPQRGDQRGMNSVLANLFGSNIDNPSPHSSKSNAYKIIDFVLEEPSHRDEDTITIDSRWVQVNKPRKPEIQNLSIEQWGYGSIAILLHMIENKEVNMQSIRDYLCDIKNTFRFFHRYLRGSALLHDKEYREAQAK
ncbi:hypothetical protein KP79_PYT23989 [Mizuhopecten yessoensis]|uniref:Uncharacterized protein n=1 Tax=Mizuhopecten yessoensis TaxID=6573 RepID=A0A210PPX5_MIZYE|nr:hypothetical protein KP79_PYT23989 [Mizuhopecten yessoensis]